MTKQTNYLSPKVFAKMLAHDKKFVSSTIKKELKSAGMSGLFSQPKITRRQAQAAINHLKDKGMLPPMHRVAKIYGDAAQEQYRLDAAAELAEKQKHIKTNIRIDRYEQMAEDERNGNPIDYDGSDQGRISEQIRREQAQKASEQKTNSTARPGSDTAKLGQLSKAITKIKPDLPDMEIDSGD